MTTPPTKPERRHEGWRQSSTCRAVEEAGQAAGRAYGLAESKARALARLLSRQATRKFGSADPKAQAILDGLAKAFACDRLLDLGEALVTAAGWTEWLGAVTVPPPAPGLPDYTKDLEIEISQSSPSIDSHMRVPMKGGGNAIIHLRLQKWYQPDLDRHLYVESRKLQRKHGAMPIVCVILMWPPAEGPGTTGRYEERDAKGKVQRVFTYKLQRAWEMEPEHVMHSPGTMILAPLTKGSKERMPEIVQMLKSGLENQHADQRTREMIWDAVYWSMGLICDFDEVKRALGDMLPVIEASPWHLAAKGQCFMDAYATAGPEGRLEAARALVLRQATCRFGGLAGTADKLKAITMPEKLEALADRVLTAPDWDAVLA